MPAHPGSESDPVNVMGEFVVKAVREGSVLYRKGTVLVQHFHNASCQTGRKREGSLADSAIISHGEDVGALIFYLQHGVRTRSEIPDI